MQFKRAIVSRLILAIEKSFGELQRVRFLVGNGNRVRGRSRTRLAGLLVGLDL